MVDLKAFIEETICQIIEGVQAAQARTGGTGGVVNPLLTGPNALLGQNVSDLAAHGLFLASGAVTQLVEFDVAVTATEGKGTKAGAGIVLGVLSLGAGGQSQAETSAANRVKFRVPVALPHYR